MCFPCRSFCFVQCFKLFAVIRNELLVQLFNALEVLSLKKKKKQAHELLTGTLVGFLHQKGIIPQFPYLACSNDITSCTHCVRVSLILEIGEQVEDAAQDADPLLVVVVSELWMWSAINTNLAVSNSQPAPSPNHCQGLQHRNTELLQTEFQLSSSELGGKKQHLINVTELSLALP